ncbi:xylulokinase [Longispora fulva]|uniref:Xylulose kinase n=1 Tax=Longispora fulva TaxID=619741 RepID=A0A8J7GFJ3_9ACTN|nr:FGGY-family carbohydrate kinase [Longispora fulva]MBG6136885.1 xylulokinase [Longispora fulva]GIG60056.1 xylulokinase [Longispora fulva]
MTLVAGVDSSTQSCKVVVVDAATGAVLRSGRAPHPDGTEAHPDAWRAALDRAVADAGGLGDCTAVSVAAQQHGMVCLDGDGGVVRPALLWNDTRSADAALDLIADLGGPGAWAEAVGSVPVASFTVTKLRWLAEHEPQSARRTAAVCLPHDWLTWQLTGRPRRSGDHWEPTPAGSGSGSAPGRVGPPVGGAELSTDRGDASGTGYYSAATGRYRPDLAALALGHLPDLPRVLGPAESPGATPDGLLLGPGTGDNAAAALGLGARPGDVVVSIGTSGTVFAVSATPTADPTGAVAGFADATGRHLPLVCTMNAARVLDAACALLGVDHTRLSDLALSAAPGAGGLVLVPYLAGERTPDRPDATGSVHGLTLATATPAHLARAAVEGLLCGLADGLDALVACGVRVDRVLLVGGGAASEAVRRIAPAVLGRPVVVPSPGEYVAVGAARQAAWSLAGTPDAPVWADPGSLLYEADPTPAVRHRYAEVRDLG